jgi:hypothetical protein
MQYWALMPSPHFPDSATAGEAGRELVVSGGQSLAVTVPTAASFLAQRQWKVEIKRANAAMMNDIFVLYTIRDWSKSSAKRR